MTDNEFTETPPPTGGDAAAPAAADPATRAVTLQRVYCKDASLEVPGAPQVFTRNWTPQLDVRVNTQIDTLGEDFYHVVLEITVTSKAEEQVLFLVETQQAGVFEIKGFEQGPELGAILGAYCPGVIFPFARETVADLIQRGGFPAVLLQPVDFNSVYMDHLRTQAEAAQGTEASAGSEVPPTTANDLN